jgi:hypothetical protein
MDGRLRTVSRNRRSWRQRSKRRASEYGEMFAAVRVRRLGIMRIGDVPGLIRGSSESPTLLDYANDKPNIQLHTLRQLSPIATVARLLHYA